MKISPEKVNDLQKDVSLVRNICILAHVDHGKTSLSDSLLSSNGIISQRQAGKIRYLDFRDDEQLRGITMESSAISLYFKILRRKTAQSNEGNEESEIKEYLINLIDSPGHIDFSSEVSTASRLCDGALVLVDVVEGVCSQTITVLRQCWLDGLKPILVLNKIDRLILEWKLTPLEAYQHLSRVIEQVNSVIGSLYAGDRMEEDLKWREKGQLGDFVEKDDTDIYFSPEKNNVIFSSAFDGWAFSVNTFAAIYHRKLGFSHAVLSKTLWGDYHLDMKNKKIVPGKKLKSSINAKPLFVSLILEQIWALYDCCMLNRDQEKIEKIIEKLGVKVTQRDLRAKEYRKVVSIIASQWIPLSHAVLGSVIDILPNPRLAQQTRIPRLLEECYYNIENDSENNQLTLENDYKESIIGCKSDVPGKNTLAFVSKMISVPNDLLQENTVTEMDHNEFAERGRKARELARLASESFNNNQVDENNFHQEIGNDGFEWEMEEDFDNLKLEEDTYEEPSETLIAFTRIYSGSLSKGQTVTVIGPKYDPILPLDHENNQEQVKKDIEVKNIYLIMGKEFVSIDNVPAGNIVGIVGFENIVLKNATICSEDRKEPYLNLASTSALIHSKPIIKIAVEPTNPSQLERLERGLGSLSKADPVFEWYTDDDSGEIIMCVAGELHLERCLKDLEERFAKNCDVTVKEPLIPFREGLSSVKDESATQLEDSEVEVKGIDLDFETFAIPKDVTDFLIKSEPEIQSLVNISPRKSLEDVEALMNQFKNKLIECFKNSSEFTNLMPQLRFDSVEKIADSIICFGPKRVGPNILVESESNANRHRRFFSSSEKVNLFEYEGNILSGFQLAANEGPLAAEVMQGVLVLVKNTAITESGEETGNLPLSGTVITRTRDLIHKAFLRSSPRLFLAMYSCDIQAAPDVLGKVYAVVQKRGGSVISEEMKEGTPFFTVEARIPIVEAFGFSEDIRKRTSGAASPQLLFDGFDMLDIDPFWVPHTEEELEELGEFAERENIARKYVNTIRRRKGLFVDEKVVKDAEKQRNLKKD
ncbi:Piso0_005087 [Millerozyma farinosa CBS 7064]|uniref:Ribosome assembly protein 1 n=1 Tax=Pichia sorbitophila (strain ATCC MYA-4447 / BCRC 22081 / CBS 7064 / NBRC 10061 / NRRL Y-12695) TaxID=559304 RepID=G8Y472_PICSO|nr:Piso0_005087 [Millerozyma farinosa CBS 7064]